MAEDRRRALDTYIAAFSSLTPDNLPDLLRLLDPDIHFRDPFNDVRGRDMFEKIFRDMFETLEQPVFSVSRSFPGGDQAVLVWCFTARFRGKSHQIEGLSEVTFGPDGLVTAHIDHWDAASQVYEKFPIIGPLLRVLKRRIAV